MYRLSALQKPVLTRGQGCSDARHLCFHRYESLLELEDAHEESLRILVGLAL